MYYQNWFTIIFVLQAYFILLLHLISVTSFPNLSSHFFPLSHPPFKYLIFWPVPPLASLQKIAVFGSPGRPLGCTEKVFLLWWIMEAVKRKGGGGGEYGDWIMFIFREGREMPNVSHVGSAGSSLMYVFLCKSTSKQVHSDYMQTYGSPSSLPSHQSLH